MVEVLFYNTMYTTTKIKRPKIIRNSQNKQIFLICSTFIPDSSKQQNRILNYLLHTRTQYNVN